MSPGQRRGWRQRGGWAGAPGGCGQAGASLAADSPGDPGREPEPGHGENLNPREPHRARRADRGERLRPLARYGSGGGRGDDFMSETFSQVFVTTYENLFTSAHFFSL